jgi:hypothetical protein
MPGKVRITAKQVEKKLVATARRLREDPLSVVPECQGSCRSCPFDKLKKTLAKLTDEAYVEKMARKKGFVAAVAATMQLAGQKVPYAAFLKIGDENVYFAKRGKVQDELLVGIQNWEKPNLRMLAYANLAKKMKVNLFSLPDRIVCADAPPAPFLSFLKKTFSCAADEYLSVVWRETELRCCGAKNSLAEMKTYFHYPKFTDEITVTPRVRLPECLSDCPDCPVTAAQDETLDIRHYLDGEMTDLQFLENYRKNLSWNLEKRPVFIADNRCFDHNVEAFIEALQPKDWEREAVREIVTCERKAIIIEQTSATKLLETYGVNVQKLREEYLEQQKRERLTKLPDVTGDERTRFVDGLARVHRVGGRDGVVQELKEKNLSFKEKAVAYAFLVAMRVEGEEWKYGPMEREFGEHLAPQVARLLAAEGEEYRNVLTDLVRELG